MKQSFEQLQAPTEGVTREQQLRLIVKKLQVRGQNGAPAKVTFAAVADLAGVSTALIHNHYPKVADVITTVQGRFSRAMRDEKQKELQAEREKTKQLRKEVKDLQLKVRSLASINGTLTAEIEALRAQRQRHRSGRQKAKKSLGLMSRPHPRARLTAMTPSPYAKAANLIPGWS